MPVSNKKTRAGRKRKIGPVVSLQRLVGPPSNPYEWVNCKTGETVILTDAPKWATFWSGKGHFYTDREGWRYDWITAKRPNAKVSEGAGRKG